MSPQTSIEPSGVTLDDIIVELDGVSFQGWESLRVSRELNTANGSFELSAALSRPWPAKAGANAKIYLGEDLVSTGYVDAVRLGLSATSHTVTISGRDRTSDLVDCSVPPKLGQLSNVYLDQIAEALAGPLEVEVDVRESGAPFKLFAPNQGDTAWSTLERAARMRAKLCYVTADGKLRVDRPGFDNAVGTIREGEADLELRWENSDKFQLYIVRGQGRGSDEGWGKAVAAIHAEAFDASIRRPRTLVILAESALDTATAQERADWEKTVRWARSASVLATLRGWRQSWKGPLWELNQLVPVNVPRWGFTAELLVDAVEFTRGSEGTKTTLRLIRKDAYLPEPGKDGDPFETWSGQPASELEGDEDG